MPSRGQFTKQFRNSPADTDSVNDSTDEETYNGGENSDDTCQERHQASCTSSSPFNSKNVLLQIEDVQRIFHRYNTDHIVIKDVNWYRKALTHRSYCTRKNENFLQGNSQCPADCLPLQEESNECLEFLGDAVLGAVVGAYLKERYPDENEGFLTRMRTKLVNGNMLSEMSRMAGLDRYVIISKQIEENNGRRSKNILEDCFEAFVGAIFEDGDRGEQFNRARDWLEAFVEEHIDFTELITQNSSYKDSLCKYFQHAFRCMPRFVDVESPHQQNAPPDITNNGEMINTHPPSSFSSTGGGEFTVCIKNKDNVVVGKGSGSTKKMAENAASKRALAYFGQLSN